MTEMTDTKPAPRFTAKEVLSASITLAHMKDGPNTKLHVYANMLRAYADHLARPKLTREELAQKLYALYSQGGGFTYAANSTKWLEDADALIAAGVVECEK